jgi:hypothetical protein
MKMAELYSDFNWDDLVDFKMKAPFIPESLDISTHMNNQMNTYESVIEVLLVYIV